MQTMGTLSIEELEDIKARWMRGDNLGDVEAEYDLRHKAISRYASAHNWKADKGSEAPRTKEEKDELTWAHNVEVERLQSTIRHLRRVNSQAAKEKVAVDRLVAAATDAIRAADPVTPPPKVTPSAPSGTEHTLVALLSDVHVGEVVRPEETNNLSAYDMELFDERMDIWTNKVVDLVSLRRSQLYIPKLELFMLGDIVSGDIHEELENTNAGSIIDQVVTATHRIASSILVLAQHFDEITISCVAGNHGRMKRKPYYKHKQPANWDVLIGQMLRLILRHQKNVSFIIPGSHWMMREVPGCRFLLMHGDGIKGWSGIPWYGVQRAVSSFLEMIGRDVMFDRAVMGHFHNPVDTENWHINGCFKGGDEFSIGAIFAANRPSQTLLYVHPRHGVVGTERVYLDGERRKFQVLDDSWKQLDFDLE